MSENKKLIKLMKSARFNSERKKENYNIHI